MLNIAGISGSVASIMLFLIGDRLARVSVIRIRAYWYCSICRYKYIHMCEYTMRYNAFPQSRKPHQKLTPKILPGGSLDLVTVYLVIVIEALGLVRGK